MQLKYIVYTLKGKGNYYTQLSTQLIVSSRHLYTTPLLHANSVTSFSDPCLTTVVRLDDEGMPLHACKPENARDEKRLESDAKGLLFKVRHVRRQDPRVREEAVFLGKLLPHPQQVPPWPRFGRPMTGTQGLSYSSE